MSSDRHYENRIIEQQAYSSFLYFSAPPATFNQGSRSASTALGRPTGSGDSSPHTNSNPPSSLIASFKGPSISPAFPLQKCQTKHSVGKSTLPAKTSNTTHPSDQMSTAQVYSDVSKDESSAPRISGAAYEGVKTRVQSMVCSLIHFDTPKSPSFTRSGERETMNMFCSPG